ncbi:TOBE domain-containing protein [Alsobacter sp. SYSU M60028]|uniref:TOBE domain-containing protein n=1 Tax=Alsobacter ponti TaxID=2962936 RepID=A0ABT1L8T8_9HYPH|nr:TOBE domain-containing protein [Alsobacter ponti]MCP8937496.1 TOBE domain-containing protein [Alsobacter ponti]
MLRASVSLSDGNGPAVGRERIRLLEAVAREGSISAGARLAGVSYKGAWDALAAMANLFGAPLLDTQTGGKAGGGARLTPAGHAVIAAFNRLEGELARALKHAQGGFTGAGMDATAPPSGFMMRTSARNVLRGTISELHHDTLSAEVSVTIAPETTVHALITRDSLEELGLVVGRDALVLVKANFIMLAAPDAGMRISARNRLPGVVRRFDTEDVNAHVVVDIGGDRTLTASVTADAVRSLALFDGVRVDALFDPSHVILAVD